MQKCCRSLRLEDRPDYADLPRLLKDLFFCEDYQFDFVFDWTVMNSQSKSESQERALHKDDWYVLRVECPMRG